MRATVQVNPGDLVRIVAPAWKGAAENLPLIKAYVESLGLVAEITENIYNDDEPLYSNFDEFRANDLASAILNEDCKVIWCIRGGAGATRLIPYLDELLPTQSPSPKLLIGFSEITTLHIYLQKKYNWQTIHGAMLESIVDGTYDQSSGTVRYLVDLIFNRLITMCYPVLTRLDLGPTFTDPIQAPIIGGNLSLTQVSIGTSWQIVTEGKIVFFEDIWVESWSIERKLEHLKQSGIINNARAIVFGDFTDTDSQELVSFVLARFATDPVVKCPVFRLQGIGHEAVNIPLPLNTEGEIKFVEPQGIYQLCDQSINGT